MRACIFASSSSGNCLLLSQGSTHILIDAGISMRRIVSSLAQGGLTMRDIGGVLITHEHSDHISGLYTLLRRSDVPLYAPHTLANRLRGMLPGAEARIHVIPVGERFALGDFSVLAFHTSHDAQESVGYRVDGEGSFALATDTGCVTPEMISALTGADTVLLESNHDEQLLRDGPYPFYLKRRILSDTGHLSNARCARLAQQLAGSGTRRIILGHLSRTNNTPALAVAETARALAGMNVALSCAPAAGFLEIPVGVDEKCCL